MQFRQFVASGCIPCCVFLSGAAGLIYEMAFARYLGLFLGMDGYAVLAVLVAFMLGLAIGYAKFGRSADKKPDRALRLYALLEAGIALYALCFPLIHSSGEKFFISAVIVWHPGATGLTSLKFVFALLTIIVPAVFMGGTLPAILRFAARASSQLRARVGTLYFVNSLGAVFGVLAAEFALVPTIGLPGTLRVGAAMNLLAGAGALFMSRISLTEKLESERAALSSVNERTALDQSSLIIAGVAISGFAALLYEVAWTRMLALTLGSTTHAFSLMLAAFIAGIAAGSWVIAKWKSPIQDSLTFSRIEIVLGIIVFASLPVYSFLPYAFMKCANLLAREPSAYGLYACLQGSICIAVMFVPTLLFGATLPLASRAATSTLATAGRSVGRVFAFNTFGGVTGAIAAGLWLMPELGLARTFGVGIAANLVAGVTVWRGIKKSNKSVSWLVAVILLIGTPWVCGKVFNADWQRGFTLGLWRQPGSVTTYAELKNVVRENNLKFYRDGAVTTVSVNGWSEGGAEHLNLRVNGKPDASTAGDMPTQLLLGHLPMLLRPQSEQALVIGLGSGITCGAITRHSTLKHLDVVEISPEVAEAAQLFSPYNHKALADPRVVLTIDDARSFLCTSKQTYDVIVSEPSNPWIGGVAGVFSREFYERCRGHLRPDGIMVQWVHIYDSSPETLDVVVRTFSSVFPSVSIWQSEELDLILVGSGALWKPDIGVLLARFNEPEVRADLARIHLLRPVVLLAREVISELNGRFVADPSGPSQTDLRPVLEYLAQRALFVHRDATQYLELDENFSLRSQTLLAEYLRKNQLTSEDYRAFAEFYFSYNLPSPQLLRSFCRRWQSESPAQGDLIELLPRLPALGSLDELEALRLTAVRKDLIARADRNPALLRYYAKLLLQVYHSQRSIFYLPPASELQSILERLLVADPSGKPLYQLTLAELAWDRGATDTCIHLSREAVGVIDWHSLREDADFNAGVARFIEALLSDGKQAEAREVSGRACKAACHSLRLDVACRRAAGADGNR